MLKFTPFINIFHLVQSFYKNFSFEEFKKLDCIKSNHKDIVQFMSRSSWFIFLICLLRKDRFKNKINVWLPSYFCYDPIFLLEKLDININYYDIDPNFELNQESIENLERQNRDPDIILMCNFIGKKISDSDQLKFSNLKKKYNAWLIQDATHCIDFSIVDTKHSDFTLISPYKFFSLPYGSVFFTSSAFLQKNKISFLNDEYLTHQYLRNKINNLGFSKKNNIIIFLVWIIKSIISFFYANVKIKSFNEDLYVQDINSLPAPEINKIIKNYIFLKFKTIEKIKFNIKKNSIILKKFILSLPFKAKEELKIEETKINNPFTPYLLRISSNKNTIYKFYEYLKQLKIPVMTWPNLSNDSKLSNSYKNAINLRNSNIYLALNYQTLPLRYKIKKVLSKNLILKEEEFDYEIIKISKFEEWKKLTKSINKTNILQDWHYGESQKATRGVVVSRFLIKTKKENKALVQLFAINKFFINLYFINRGPIFFDGISEKESLKIIKFLFSKYHKISELKLLRFNPNLEINSNNVFINQNKKLIFFKEPFWQSSLIDLNNEISIIRENFTGSIKNDLNFFNKKKNEVGINVYENFKNPIPENKLNHIKNLYLADQKKKKFYWY